MTQAPLGKAIPARPYSCHDRQNTDPDNRTVRSRLETRWFFVGRRRRRLAARIAPCLRHAPCANTQRSKAANENSNNIARFTNGPCETVCEQPDRLFIRHAW